jgi:hypothetical protein
MTPMPPDQMSDCEKMLRLYLKEECLHPEGMGEEQIDDVLALAAGIRREENEACAKVVEKEASPEMMLERFTDDFAGGVIGASNAIAAAIRARVKERK